MSGKPAMGQRRLRRTVHLENNRLPREVNLRARVARAMLIEDEVPGEGKHRTGCSQRRRGAVQGVKDGGR